MKHKEIKVFTRFLKEVGVYITFLKLLKTYKWDKRLTVKEYLEEIKQRDVISSAFDWSSTVEGHMFWQKIHETWISINIYSPDVAEKLISFKKLKETLRSLHNKNANAIL